MLVDKIKLKEIDEAIDSSIKELPLLQLDREVALVHLLSYYEKFVTHDSMEIASDIIDHNIIIKNAQDGIDFAVQWIYKYCRNGHSHNLPRLRPRLLNQARQLLDKAMDYSSIWDYMNLIHRDMCQANIDDVNTITLEMSDNYKLENDIINRFLNVVDTEDDIDTALDSFFETNPQELIEEIDYKFNGSRLVYEIPDSVYIKVAKSNYESKKHLHNLPPDWDLGGYTVKDFRHFYNCLRTKTFIHIQGCMVARAQRTEVSNLFMIQSREEWISEIMNCITIDKKTCEIIFDQLVYDYSLYETANKSPDITYQPFVLLSNGKYLLVNSLVQQSNYERNQWELLSIINPDLHSILRNKKEEFWREELKELCKKLNLSAKGPFPFKCSQGRSDIDIILIDRENKTILLIELKWLTSPDRIKDVIYLSKELGKGLSQIELALFYVEEKKDEFATKVEIDENKISEYEILGLVMSKNSMGNGYTHQENIPIINERIFKWLLSEPHHKDIKTLWKIGDELRFMPKEGIHFRSKDTDSSFGNYHFIAKQSGMIMLKQFDPKTDINFEGLSNEHF